MIRSIIHYGNHPDTKKLIALFPDEIDVFVNLFDETGEIGLNTTANIVIYNFTNKNAKRVFDFANRRDNLIADIETTISLYKLSNTSKRVYKKYNLNAKTGLKQYNDSAYRLLKSDWSKSDPQNIDYVTKLLVLIIYGLGHKANKPSSVGSTDFNKEIKADLKSMISAIKSQDNRFESYHYSVYMYYNLEPSDFVLADITKVQKGWSKTDKKEFYKFAKFLCRHHINFMIICDPIDYKLISKIAKRNKTQRFKKYLIIMNY